jgi:photosystem II stability/assembly factor-like uncharacterized protein
MRSRKLKVLFGGLALLLAVLACGVPAPSTPTVTVPPVTATPTVPTLPVATSPSIQSLDMLDANNGWGVGANAVYRTADGGATWFDATPSAGISSAPRGFFFLNPATGWVVLSVTDPTNGTLYHTTDGGVTWTSASVPFSGGSLSFTDPSNGWDLVGLNAGMSHEAVAVFRTSDGGSTWTQVFVDDPTVSGSSDTLPLVGDKNGITALDANHAWVTGAQPSNDFIYDYITTDGGTTWVHQNVVVPTGYTGAMTSAFPPTFFGATEAVLPVQLFADTNGTDFYLSHDGGATWATSTPLAQGGFIAVGSQTDFFVWDGGTTLNVSHDAGTTWSTVTPNVNLMDKMGYFQFIGSSTGWALTSDSSDHHMLYKTTDGGVTWNVLIP